MLYKWLYMLQLFVYCYTVLEISPRQNMWVTWANETGTTDFCIAMASATAPFRTCLIGIPGFNVSLFADFSTGSCKASPSLGNCSAELILGLTKSLPWDPQELNLLGSQAVGNVSGNWTPTCIVFGPKYAARAYPDTWPDISPTSGDYRLGSGYCGYNGSKPMPVIGTTHNPKANIKLIWVRKTAKALPPTVFLICGDRAWQGIPRNAVGGPCYLGSLTLFAPRYAELRQIVNPIYHARNARSLGLTPQCDDNVKLLNVAARTALALFIPGAAAGNALTNLARLACWAEKQANITTEILDNLLMDQNSLRHALLQNRAAIDFLLLAQGHGCQEFEGMCCMNLSDHSDSIHASIMQLKRHTQKIQQQIKPPRRCFHNLAS